MVDVVDILGRATVTYSNEHRKRASQIFSKMSFCVFLNFQQMVMNFQEVLTSNTTGLAKGRTTRDQTDRRGSQPPVRVER